MNDDQVKITGKPRVNTYVFLCFAALHCYHWVQHLVTDQLNITQRITMLKVNLSGGFHNAAQINLRVKDGALSLGQYKRLSNHMCGIKGCVCGWRGYDIEGISKSDFDEMVMNASYKSSMKGA